MENEKRFRRANELLQGRVEDVVDPGRPIPFLCECSDEACLARVDLTLAQYRDVRASEQTFVVVAGHAAPPVETVVADAGDYQIVRKEAV